jgi:hypothetical protein
MSVRNEYIILKCEFLSKIRVIFSQLFDKKFIFLLILTTVFPRNALCIHLTTESNSKHILSSSTSTLKPLHSSKPFQHNLLKCPTQNENTGSSLKYFFNPTVVKATAIKKYKIFDVNSYHSIVFHIKKIFKYENRVEEMNNKSASFTNKSNNSHNNFFKISSQEENSTTLNNNSIILVDFFNLKGNEDCMSQVEIGRDYFLFLKSLNPSIKLEKRRHFTTGLDPKYFPKHKLGEVKNKSVSTNGQNEVFTIKMPIFEAIAAPSLAEINSKTEASIQDLLCFMDAYCMLSKEQEKFSYKKELSQPVNNLKTVVTKVNINKNTKTKALKNSQKTKSSKQVNTRDQYIKCENFENTCENNGECFVTNENFYLYKSSSDKTKINFCM